MALGQTGVPRNEKMVLVLAARAVGGLRDVPVVRGDSHTCIRVRKSSATLLQANRNGQGLWLYTLLV